MNEPSGDPVRIAILGGGMAGLTAAFELTATAELRQRFAVTVYQQGWRLGGKCASGRNAALGQRIEEHGLHLWFGLYENAFALMRRCYGELHRPAGSPLATVEEAFTAHDQGVLWDDYDGTWKPFDVRFARFDQLPGDGSPLPGFWDIAARGLEANWNAWRDVRHRGALHAHHLLPGWAHRIADDVGAALDAVAHRGEDAVLHIARHIANRRRDQPTDPDDPSERHDRALLSRLVRHFRDWVWVHAVEPRIDDDQLRQWFTRMDLAVTMMIGIVDDAVHDGGFAALDEEELRAWLTRHGARPVTLEGPMVRAWYCGAFAFMGGDTTKPNIAAGVSVSAMLRQELGYKGSVLWRMNAGMGDAVVAPLYQALVARGVRVELFHRVTALHTAEDGASVDRIDLCRQVPSPGDYDPLVDVGGLPCWPNTPVWERLSGGDAWRTAEVDFEAEDGPEATGVTLRQGDDFDKVVLAISVAALPAICAELLADPSRPRFAAMVANASTCMTQGFQVWMNAGLTDRLGWKHGSDISSTYVEPLDTYCDMSQLIDAEAWPADAGVRSIAYFCGVLDDRLNDTQDTATRRAHDSGVAFLRDCSGALWPGAVVGGGFDFGLLVDPDGADGEERFDRQFWRANFAATERYVQTPMGSVKHRLAAGDSEWDNLVYAGDWTHTGVDLGCVEAAVMSGMQASRALSGSPAVVHGEDHRWLAGHGGHGAPRTHG